MELAWHGSGAEQTFKAMVEHWVHQMFTALFFLWNNGSLRKMWIGYDPDVKKSAAARELLRIAIIHLERHVSGRSY